MSGHLAVRLFRRLYPLPSGYAEAGPPLEELRPLYGKWQVCGLILFLSGCAVWSSVWWLLFHNTAQWIAPYFGPGIYHLYPTSIIFLLPAMFLGILSCTFLLNWVYRRLLKDRYSDYARYDNLSAGYDSARAVKPLALGMGLLPLAMIALALSWHVVFRENDATFHSWCGLGTTTKLYSDVKEIRTAPQLRAPSGKLVDRREYVVEFDDGTTWSTNFQPGDLSLREKKSLFEFIAKKSEKPIRELQILE